MTQSFSSTVGNSTMKDACSFVPAEVELNKLKRQVQSNIYTNIPGKSEYQNVPLKATLSDSIQNATSMDYGAMMNSFPNPSHYYSHSLPLPDEEEKTSSQTGAEVSAKFNGWDINFNEITFIRELGRGM